MKRYLSLTRTRTYSLLFALPLLLLYEVGAIYIARSEGSLFRNGADVLLRTFLALGGLEGTAGAMVVVIVGAAILILVERSRRPVPLRAAPFFGMAAESFLYASLLGIVVGGATQFLLDGIAFTLAAGSPLGTLSLSEGIVLSLGAGLYEELVFRVILAGGIFAGLRGSGLGAGQAGTVAVLVSSLLFSGFHYIGPYGDAWALPSFLFRFIAGMAFSALFLVRGFGITAWTHALYDVMLILSLHV